MSQLFTSGGQSIGVSASISVLPMNPGLIPFRMDWLDRLVVQGTFKSLLQSFGISPEIFSSVQLLSHVRLFATLWTAGRQASLSITNSQSLLQLMSIESVMPSNHLIICHPFPLLPSVFPSITVFSSESVLRIGGQSIGVSASASVLPMNIQD